MSAYHVSIFYLITFKFCNRLFPYSLSILVLSIRNIGLSKIYLFTAVQSALHFKISLSKSTADPDLHTDPATFGSCLSKWSLHSLQSH